MAELTGTEYKHKIRQQAKSRVIKFRQEQEQRGYKNLTVFFSEPFRIELDRLSTEKGFNRQQALDHVFSVYQHALSNKNVTSNATRTENKTTENTGFIDILQKPAIDMPENESKKQAPDQATTTATGTADTTGHNTGSAPAQNHHELEFEPDQDTGKAATTTATESTPDHLDTCTPATVTDTGTPETATDQAPATGKTDTTTGTGKKQAPDQAMVKGYPNRQLEIEMDQQADATPATENKSVMVREFDKDEICKVIVELKDGKGLGWTDISRELKAMGYSPKNSKKDTFHHSTVSNYYKDGNKSK